LHLRVRVDVVQIRPRLAPAAATEFTGPASTWRPRWRWAGCPSSSRTCRAKARTVSASCRRYDSATGRVGALAAAGPRSVATWPFAGRAPSGSVWRRRLGRAPSSAHSGRSQRYSPELARQFQKPAIRGLINSYLSPNVTGHFPRVLHPFIGPDLRVVPPVFRPQYNTSSALFHILM
jgi:hypothetical protein